MIKKLIVLVFCFSIFSNLNSMDNKPYHHLPDNTFRNPEGSPVRNDKIKWSYSTFNKEKKKLDMTVPDDHVLKKEYVLKDLASKQNSDYIGWIGHATFLIKLGETTIITDPVFSKNAGPLIFGPKRYVAPALNLNEIPKIDLFLLTHNHYDHQDMGTIRKFPYKDANVIVPLKLGKYFTKNNFKKVSELDWYQSIEKNDLKITMLPAVHWSKRSLTDTNKTLWGSYLIEYKRKKILFACDTGYGEIYKEIGEKFGPFTLICLSTATFHIVTCFLIASYSTIAPPFSGLT